MSDKPHSWAHPIISGICDNPFNSFYGTLFPCCALASAKAQFDGSDWCFNFFCFSCHIGLVRSYIRQGYRIDGEIGISDCFIPSLCIFYPCVVTQLLNEVGTRGPKLISIPTHDEAPWQATPRETSCFKDPLDILFTSSTSLFENASAYSLLSGSPMWFSWPMNICQLNHIARKSYGIGGNDCVGDCLVPTVSICIPIFGCIYYHQMVSQIKGEIWDRGQAPNFGYPYMWKEEDDQFADLPPKKSKDDREGEGEEEGDEGEGDEIVETEEEVDREESRRNEGRVRERERDAKRGKQLQKHHLKSNPVRRRKHEAEEKMEWDESRGEEEGRDGEGGDHMSRNNGGERAVKQNQTKREISNQQSINMGSEATADYGFNSYNSLQKKVQSLQGNRPNPLNTRVKGMAGAGAGSGGMGASQNRLNNI